jgi:hypothetical protein
LIYLKDEFLDHPKVIRAGGDAGWLYVCALGWSNKHLTGGFIPAEVVGRLSDRKAPSKLAQRLVDVGLWDKVDGGYQVHDYDEHNYGAEAKRQAREAKARKAAQARWERERAKKDAASGNAPGNAPSIATGSAQAEDEQCSAMPPTRAPSPSPLPPTRELVTNFSRHSDEPSTDDDGVFGPAEEAAEKVADARLTRRIVEKGPVGNPDAWRREAARRAFPDVLGAMEQLGPDADADELAEWVLVREPVVQRS